MPIVTLNGIAAWTDDFDRKHSPASEFLVTRSLITLTLMHGDRLAGRRIFRQMGRNALKFGLCLDYASMNAVLDGMEMVARGPAAFAEEPAPLERLARLNAYSRPDMMSRADFENLSLARRPKGWRSIAARLLAGGYLRPRARDPRVPYALTSYHMHRWAVFASDKAAYGNGDDIRVMKRDARRMVSLWIRWFRLAWTLGPRFAAMADAYKTGAGEYRSERYWRLTFGKEG